MQHPISTAFTAGGPAASSREAAPSHGARICDIVAGPTLCALRVWSEAEWETMAEDDRPAECAHFPGLGWVGAVPIARLN
jgi:hypothetical protein